MQPIAAPSAFSEEQYLCDAEHIAEFDARVAECRDGSCAGRISFRGVIDSQPVVLDTAAHLVDYQTVETAHGPQVGIIVWSSAPYFKYRLSFISISEPGSDLTTVYGTLQSNNDFINLEARGGNYLVNWVNETRDYQTLTSEEVRFTFSTDLARGGHLDGCLDVFLPPQ